MCKILSGDSKVFSRKRRKKDGNEPIRKTKKHDYDSLTLNQRREVSRASAKKRRSNENERLASLYLSLPVPSHTRLLVPDDVHFIGYFEKTTIIKVAGYVLKLYNSLTDANRFPSFYQRNDCAISMFSETLIGIFWCENSKKIVYTTPGLARLTGLYWCNLIGMPMNSIFVNSTRKLTSNPPSDLMFLRFMKDAILDRGIFTVRPTEPARPEVTESNEEKRSSTSIQLVGKMPCSVWSSERLGNGFRFDIIQPFFTPTSSISGNLIYIRSTGNRVDSLPTNNNEQRPIYATGKPFTAYFDLESYGTIAVEEGFLQALGFDAEELEDSNIFSFFHMEEVVKLSESLKEIMDDKSHIRQNQMKIFTSKEGISRVCQVTFQVNGDQELVMPNIFNARSSVNQGEAYSQNVAEALQEFDREDENDPSSVLNMRNVCIQLRCLGLGLSYESGASPINEASVPDNAVQTPNVISPPELLDVPSSVITPNWWANQQGNNVSTTVREPQIYGQIANESPNIAKSQHDICNSECAAYNELYSSEQSQWPNDQSGGSQAQYLCATEFPMAPFQQDYGDIDYGRDDWGLNHAARPLQNMYEEGFIMNRSLYTPEFQICRIETPQYDTNCVGCWNDLERRSLDNRNSKHRRKVDELSVRSSEDFGTFSDQYRRRKSSILERPPVNMVSPEARTRRASSQQKPAHTSILWQELMKP